MSLSKSQLEKILLNSISNSKKTNLKVSVFLLLATGLGAIFIRQSWGFYTFSISAGITIVLIPLLLLFSWFNSKSYLALIQLMNESPEKIFWSYSLSQTTNGATIIYLVLHTADKKEIRIEENDLIRQGVSMDDVFNLFMEMNPDCMIGYSEKRRAYFSQFLLQNA